MKQRLLNRRYLARPVLHDEQPARSPLTHAQAYGMESISSVQAVALNVVSIVYPEERQAFEASILSAAADAFGTASPHYVRPARHPIIGPATARVNSNEWWLLRADGPPDASYAETARARHPGPLDARLCQRHRRFV